MKKNYFILILFLVISTALFAIEQSNYFNDDEIDMLNMTTILMGCGYGYNSEMDINYVFIKQEQNQKSDPFNEIFKKYEKEKLYKFYYKISQIYELNHVLLNKSEKEKNWKYYNVLKSELIPGIDLYYSLLSDNIKSKYPDIYEDIQKQKSNIHKDAVLYFKTKENIVGEYK